MKRISDEEILSIWRDESNTCFGEGLILNQIAQAQLEVCEKEHKEKVREILGEIEKIDPVLLVHSFAPTVVSGELKTEHLSENECRACRWQALKQEWPEHK